MRGDSPTAKDTAVLEEIDAARTKLTDCLAGVPISVSTAENCLALLARLEHSLKTGFPSEVHLPYWQALRLDSQDLKVYRVQYAGCWTRDLEEDGLLASEDVSEKPDDEYFKAAVIDHLRGDHTMPTPFISVFKTVQQAEDWAHDWQQRNHHRKCNMYTIQLSLDDCVYSVKEMKAGFGITSGMGAQHELGHCLVLHRIPAAAIVDKHIVASGEYFASSTMFPAPLTHIRRPTPAATCRRERSLARSAASSFMVRRPHDR